MAAALNDDELSISLPSFDQDRDRNRERERERELDLERQEREQRERPSRAIPAHMRNHSAMPMPLSTRQLGKPDASKQSPATTRDMQRLDQYKTIKILGEGSFGKVKLAIHQPSGRQVALKIISRRKLLSRDMVGRVEREIQYLQLLRHPHIIKLYTVIATKADIVMVLEYAERELFDYLVRKGRCNDDEARKFFQQIICAVEYCHRHKIVHRDLKPENLLIDSEKNVKIADFGLSNIMTDGNFLKTSCGSPNYAAPEVISGKLYAGPEVDVWSSGVILYVLLVGRLPFDDDYIPALFKKIAAGNFHMPSYIASGAVRLIRAMLQVHPVHRITIPEIRQDPWFVKNLPSYLRPPAEDFTVTYPDPHLAVESRRILPGEPSSMQFKIHQVAVSKLERSMGYARDDIEDALRNPEPSAIKDAFFIIVENEMMQTNSPTDESPISAAANAPSPKHSAEPPPRVVDPVRLPESSKKPPVQVAPEPPRSLPKIPHVDNSDGFTATRASHVRILPTSLPYVHDQLMEQRDRYTADKEEQASSEREVENEAPRHGEPTPEEQAATARALKPHSRSIVDLDKLSFEPPEPTTAHYPPRKPRKWQFGIRSRNQPYEAMLYLYKAIEAQGGVWDIQPAEADAKQSGIARERMAEKQQKPLQMKYPNLPSDYYIPRDPWFIRARLLKEDVAAPGATISSRNSRSDLDQIRRRGNVTGGTSTGTSTEDRTTSGGNLSPTRATGRISYGVWVFIDIQLYQLEQNNYMVDFKCDGYQNVIRTENDTEWQPVSKRFKNKEKEINSPYPFLDVASDLVAQLAATG